MFTTSMNTDELKYMIEKKLQHPYVEKFVKKPFVDENKLDILNYLYKYIEIPTTVKQQHILTIMLVQIALDTHEQISNQRQDDNMSEKEKQLAVLAGDYYSGMYYLLLSELKEVKMIQVLASAIRKVNEHKMTLFYEDILSTHELVKLIGHIEATLYKEVACHLGVDDQITEVIQDVLCLNRLDHELKVDGVLSSNIKQQSQYKVKNEDIIFQLEEVYRRHKQQLENSLIGLPYQHLQFANMIRHKYSLSYQTSVAEEG